MAVYDCRSVSSVWGFGEARQILSILRDFNEAIQSMSFKIRNQARGNYVADGSIVDVQQVRKKIFKAAK